MFWTIRIACIAAAWAAAAAAGEGFVTADGTRLTAGAGGETVRLRGVNFSNWFWRDHVSPAHHGEQDYDRVREMGFNAVRFCMNHAWFGREAGAFDEHFLQWLDRNIGWAKERGLYVILDMHIPPGYENSQDASGLWENPVHQDRLVELWTMLAKRYRDQPAVAAYDLWNEPRVPRKAETYRRLAQRLVDSIREVDGNHLIIIEKILLFYEEGGENSGDPDVAFVDIEDDNIAYDFHFYAPGAYTHQYMDYAGLGEGGKYPDPSLIEPPQDRRWHSATSAAGHWGAGGTAWRYFEGDPVAVEDPDILAGVPAAKALTGAGAAEFAGIVVREFDATGQLVREIEAPAGGAQDGWTYWSRDGSGSHGTADGPQGGGALRMEGAGAIAVLARPLCTFEARQGHRYQAAGWVRAKDLPERGFAHVAVDWYESPSGLPVMRRDKESLAARLDRWLAWGAQHNRPVVIQELGANYHCFLDGKGGLTWYRDMLDLLEAREASYLFWCYHEEWWGFYRGTEPVTETTGREDLINLVRGALR